MKTLRNKQNELFNRLGNDPDKFDQNADTLFLKWRSRATETQLYWRKQKKQQLNKNKTKQKCPDRPFDIHTRLMIFPVVL